MKSFRQAIYLVLSLALMTLAPAPGGASMKSKQSAAKKPATQKRAASRGTRRKVPRSRKARVEQNSRLARQWSTAYGARHYRPIYSSNRRFLRLAVFGGAYPQKNVRPIEHHEVVVVDAEFDQQMQAKEDMFRIRPDKTMGRNRPRNKKRTAELDAIVAEHGEYVDTGARELLELWAEELPRFHPSKYQRDGDFIVVKPTGRRINWKSSKDPVRDLGLLVPDDMLFVKPDDAYVSNVQKIRKTARETNTELPMPTANHLLIGGSLAVPTGWVLNDFMGMRVRDIHGHIEGAERMAAMVDGFVAESKWGKFHGRNNWTFRTNHAHAQPGDVPVPVTRVTAKNVEKTVVLRMERERFFRLPNSGMFVMLFRPYTYRLPEIAQHPQVALKILRGMKDITNETEASHAKHVKPYLQRVVRNARRRGELPSAKAEKEAVAAKKAAALARKKKGGDGDGRGQMPEHVRAMLEATGALPAQSGPPADAQGSSPRPPQSGRPANAQGDAPPSGAPSNLE